MSDDELEVRNTSLKSAPQYSKFLPGAVPPHLGAQV
jgi:hypothetical protein